jgi:uncharacterized peroxidase-related enzyme
MNRLATQEVSTATGQTAELFAAIKKAAGMVPNAYVAVGTNSPGTLAAVLALDGATRHGSLSAKEGEAIRLAVSQASGCDYCLAAHTLFAKKAGLTPAAIAGARHGKPSGDAKIDALTTFARTIVTSRNTVPDDVVAAVKAAGYTDTQIVDTILVITSISFTNLFNRVNDTTVDFPPAD